MATNQTLCGKSGLEIPVYLLLGQKRLPVDLIVTKTIYSCFFNHDDSFFARWTVPLTGVEQKKNSNFFPTVARKSSSQPCCEPGLSSSAGPPPLSLSHWLQFDLGRPPLLLLWQVYFNNAGGTGCVVIAGGELWDCGDVGRVCVVEGMCPSIYSYSLQFLRKERGPSFVDSRQPPPPKLQFLFTHDTSHPSLILTYYPSTAPLSLYLSQRVLTPFFPFLNPSMSSHPRSPNWQN